MLYLDIHSPMKKPLSKFTNIINEIHFAKEGVITQFQKVQHFSLIQCEAHCRPDKETFSPPLSTRSSAPSRYGDHQLFAVICINVRIFLIQL